MSRPLCHLADLRRRAFGPLRAGRPRSQDGEHLCIALDDGDLYFAWTTLDDLTGHGVLI